MAKVTSRTTIEWPKLGFVIPAGQEVELPSDKDSQTIILSTQGVVSVPEARKRGAGVEA